MENAPDKSWKGSDNLKQAVLSQMEAHYEKAVLEPLQIDAVTLELYGWPNGVDYPGCAQTLGLDEGVLHLGFYLRDGFPEDQKGIKTLIQLRIELLEGIPVGLDLSHVCPEFIVWRLENADFGITDAQVDQSVQGLLREVVAAFYQDAPDVRMTQQKIQSAVEETNHQIRTQWQKEKKTDRNANRTLNALETAAAACTAPTNPAAAADTARLYLFGANGTNVRNLEAETASMTAKLVGLIRAAPKSK